MTTDAIARLAVVAVCGFGVFVRVANLDRAVYWNDEAVTSLWLSGHTREDMDADILTGREVGVADLATYQRVSPDRGILATLDVGTRGDPQVSPLHLVLLRLWTDVFGDSVTAARSLSALFGVLSLAAIYWLALELLGSPSGAWVATALMSVSPFHIAYSQETRTYAFWTLAVIVATAALLRALRIGTNASWAAYAAAAGLALNAHALSAPVLAAHGVYVVGCRRLALKPYFAASVVGGLLFVPWALVLLQQQAQLDRLLDWVTRDMDLGLRLALSGRGLIKNYFDFNWSEYQRFLGLFLLALTGTSVVHAWRHRPRHVLVMLLLLMASTFLFLALPDLVVGGRRSVVPRYQGPTYIGVLLSIAAMLDALVVARAPLPRRLAQLSLAILVCGGLASSMLGWDAVYVWTKGELGRDALRAADVANRQPRTLLVTDGTHGLVLSLQHLLNPDVRPQATYRPESLRVGAGFSTIVLFRVPPSARERLGDQLHVDFELVDEPGNLWRSVQKVE
jgi:uncharacterized membrane protein